MVTRSIIEVNGSRMEIREQGSGATVVVLYGYGGVPRLSPFEDALAKSFHVIALPLAGQQGSDRGHDDLHTPLDWISHTAEAIEAATGGIDVHLVAQSVSGMLGAELAAMRLQWLRSLTLIGSLGLYDEAEKPRNPFAESPPQRVPFMTRQPNRFNADYRLPAGAGDDEKHEADVIAYRADEATARLMWPFGDIGLKRRLHRLTLPVQLIWGDGDELIPPSYAKLFADGVSGPVRTTILPGCGHLVALEEPDQCAGLVRDFVQEQAVPA
jgi:pimeloyl-ACP methyl ester carboxylesterase